MMHSAISVSQRSVLQRSVSKLCALSALLGAGCTIANDVNDDPEGNAAANMYRAPSERSVALLQAPGDNLLAALAEVEANDRNVVLPLDNRVLGQLLGEVGAYFSATTTYTPFSEVLERQTMECQSSMLPDAVDTLCRMLAAPRRADDESTGGPVQLVLVNELQHVAYQRSLVRKLLGCAWDAGFRYLGLEAMAEDDASLEARGHVSKTASGVLMREPQMSRLVDDGIRLGYDIVRYDVADHCTDCRYVEAIEQHAAEQAANLTAKTFAVDPAAKVLVLTGPRQAYKRICLRPTSPRSAAISGSSPASNPSRSNRSRSIARACSSARARRTRLPACTE
jgi:hypothetical protein